MSVSATPLENRFVTGASWEDYNRYLEAVGERRIRVTYDGTMVELMTPSHRHESLKEWLQLFLVCFMEETEVDFVVGGNTTFKDTLEKKGLEPDDCYWISSWRDVLGGWSPETGPPPDLAIEVEISRSVLNRLSIYAALRVPELWRISEAGKISVWTLAGDDYQACPSSPSLPGLSLEFVEEHLAKGGQTSDMRLLKAFRQALRDRI